MYQIDVLFPAYINATIGPCGTLRRILKNVDYINSRGYNINIYTLDNVIRKDPGTNIAVDYSKGLKYKTKIKSILTKTIFGYALLQKHNLDLSKRIVDYYLSLHRNADVIVFHETNTCRVYMPHKTVKQKIVCFFHSDGTRWGMTVKAHPFLENSLWIRYHNKLFDSLFPKIDRYVFISSLGRENFLKENAFVERNKTSFFHNGIEDFPITNVHICSNKKFRLCSVGTLNHRKGQYLIVEALHKLPEETIKQISLTLYGMGPDYALLQDKIQEYKLQDTVTLYGNLNNSEVHSELSKHNIFILMSNNEGLPISIIEAMRAGLPVISTRVSGIPEEVDERNGVLINPDEKDLTAVLLKIESYEWGKMGQNSRERFEKEFTFSSMLKGYCDMIDETLERR